MWESSGYLKKNKSFLILKFFFFLKDILLSKLRNVNNNTLNHLANSQLSSKIRSLDLTCLNKFDETTLLNSFPKFPNISVLYLSSTTGVTDKVINTIAGNCRLLQKIYLSGQSALTDQSIIQLSKNCRNLSVLNVSKCNSKQQKIIIFHLIFYFEKQVLS